MFCQHRVMNRKLWIVSLIVTSSLLATAFAQGPAVIYAGDRDLQQVIDSASSNAIVYCDPNRTLTLSAPITIRKPLTLIGLRARLPEKLGSTSLILVEAKGVALTDFELGGNAESVPQSVRAPLIVIRAGDFRVERGRMFNSSKDGINIDGDSLNEDIVGGVVRDIVGRGIRRDVVSISGSSLKGGRIRNVLVDNVRGYDSAFRGAVEVSDGTDNITVRKVYAEDSVYAIDVQDHNQPGQSNRNVVVEDVYALRCRHAVRTANTRKGHGNLTLRGITAEQCAEPIRVSHTESVHVSNVRIMDHRSGKPLIEIDNCDGVTIRDVTADTINVKGTALLLQNCNQVLVDGFNLPGNTNDIGAAVTFRATTDEAFSGLRISNVAALGATEAGIIVELGGKRRGTLTDYIITGNLTTVIDRIKGERGMVTGNLP